jgi:hypothetical protein
VRAVSSRQLDVLRWIAEGTPDHAWPDYTHRTTAKALQSRGLVKVRGRGASWTAEITELGRRALDEEPRAAALRGVRPEPTGSGGAPLVAVDAADLLQRVREAPERRLVVAAPSADLRAGYRRAIAAIERVGVLDGERLTYQGRDKGDLVISLVEARVPGPPLPAVAVPMEVDADNAVVGHLFARPDQLEVSDGSRDRGLRILQALAEAFETRGHAVGAGGHESSLTVTIDGQELGVILWEGQEAVEEPSADDVAQAKYAWQRVRPVSRIAWSGRLALSVTGRGSAAKWADTTRWRLETRLPRFVHDLEILAAERTAEARAAQEARAARRHAWEEAVPKARAAHIAHVNRERLQQQLAAHRAVVELRSYADAVEARARRLAEPLRSQAMGWAAWIRAEADRQEPETAELRVAEPESISPWQLDRYMPHGWSVSGPPD